MIDQAAWIEVPAELEIELDRPAPTVGPDGGPALPPGVYTVDAIRHLEAGRDGGGRGGETWFRVTAGDGTAWLRAADCAPYDVTTWD